MKKKLAFALCTALMLCSMSVAALAAEPMAEADTVSAMISAADTLPGISAYPAEVRASEENGVYRLEKVYYIAALATRTLYDENGVPHLCLDEEKVCRMRTKLITKILDFKVNKTA